MNYCWLCKKVTLESKETVSFSKIYNQIYCSCSCCGSFLCSYLEKIIGKENEK